GPGRTSVLRRSETSSRGRFREMRQLRGAAFGDGREGGRESPPSARGSSSHASRPPPGRGPSWTCQPWKPRLLRIRGERRTAARDEYHGKRYPSIVLSAAS